MRELTGSKEDRVEAKAERLAARVEATATLKARVQEIDEKSAARRVDTASRRAASSPASHQGTLPSVQQVLAQLELEPPRYPLDEQVEVAGETFHIAGIKKVFRGRGLPIAARGSEVTDAVCVLVPEPWNPHDSNAVAVAIEGQQVGHLPADVASDYAASLSDLARAGRLVTGEARIWAKDDNGIVRARVTVCIPEASEF